MWPAQRAVRAYTLACMVAAVGVIALAHGIGLALSYAITGSI